MLSTPSPSETYCDALRSSFELLAHFLIHSKTHKKVKKDKKLATMFAETISSHKRREGGGEEGKKVLFWNWVS